MGACQVRLVEDRAPWLWEGVLRFCLLVRATCVVYAFRQLLHANALLGAVELAAVLLALG